MSFVEQRFMDSLGSRWRLLGLGMSRLCGCSEAGPRVDGVVLSFRIL